MTKKATADTIPTWMDDSLAITGAREFQAGPDGDYFHLRLIDVPIAFELDRARFDHGELIGLLTVRTELTGTRAHEGVLSVGTFNVSSPTARNTRAKLLENLARTPQIDWGRLVEEFAIRVLESSKTGNAAIDLRSLPRSGVVDAIDVHGLRVLDRHPIIAFGDGGTAKSLLTLFIGGELARRGLKVLYADWELSPEDHRDRLEDLFGADMPQMFYARCSRPMTAEVDRLRRLVREHTIDYLLCDSVAFACDGRPEDAEVASRYFQCLRQIGVGSWNIAHTNKSDESDRKPFGSAFWHNGARATWNVKASEGSRDRQRLSVGLYNRKSNLTALLPAVGFQLTFGAGRTTVEPVDVAHVEDLAGELPIWRRIQHAVQREPQTLAALAEALGERVTSIERIVRGRKNLFTTVRSAGMPRGLRWWPVSRHPSASTLSEDLSVTRHTPYDALPEFLTVDEFRMYMRLGRNTTYDLLRSGAVTHQRFGRTIRIPKAALRPEGGASR